MKVSDEELRPLVLKVYHSKKLSKTFNCEDYKLWLMIENIKYYDSGTGRVNFFYILTNKDGQNWKRFGSFKYNIDEIPKYKDTSGERGPNKLNYQYNFKIYQKILNADVSWYGVSNRGK